MRVVTREGVVTVEGLSRAEKSVVGRHDNAVRRLLTPGSAFGHAQRLPDFDDASVTGYRRGSDKVESFRLETRPEWLEFFEGRGLLRFESVYEARP